ncbi:MAG TPA: hypothetical protein VGB03_02275 [Acidimicrobiales bacterium]|jgi:hypothetical protein
MSESPRLDLSTLTPAEREQLAQLVDELALKVDAQCPDCLMWVPRRQLRQHITECVTPVVRTRRLEVLDEDGTVTVVVGNIDGERGIALRDSLGADQLVITRDDGGAGVRFYVGGTEVANFGVETDADPEREPGPYLMLAGLNGVPALGWRVDRDGRRVPVGPARPTDGD